MRVDAKTSAVVDVSTSRAARLRGAGVREVRVTGGLWRHRLDVLHKTTLPSQLEQCVTSGRLDNFRRAAGLADGPFAGKFYSDSDVYKWMEAAAWSLADNPSSDLADRLDEVLEIVAAAQRPDGYLNTYFARERAADRFTDLAVMHEMYCVGHLIQAAIAHHRVTDSARLLEVARRAADNLDATFGPDGRRGACGHPGVEMALVELARETGVKRYTRLAGWLVEQHGRTPPTISGDAYHQDHQPLAEQRAATSHVVRALYLYCAGVDLDIESGDGRYAAAIAALWHDVHERKTYVTGGVGARWEQEAFGEEYELPNHRAYAETCAAIASIMWNWRLLLATGDARYGDEIERALYNGMLAGIALSGDRFFYQNPLADEGAHRRSPWFRTACCPPNIARTISCLPGYVYAVTDNAIHVVQYLATDATLRVAAGDVALRQSTDYPNDGHVRIEVLDCPDTTWTLALRRPSWAGTTRLELNGEPVAAPTHDGWLVLRRTWTPGDTVTFHLPIEPRYVTAHPRVTNLHARVALVRGPVVYCVEAADNPDTHPGLIVLPRAGQWTPTDIDLPDVPALSMTAWRRSSDDRLYDPDLGGVEQVEVTAIPYYAWANRTAGPMAVWLHIEQQTQNPNIGGN